MDKLSLKYKPDLKIIGVALLYYLSAKLGYFFAFDKPMALPAWPPAGIGFALLILLGRAAWPGITIGALLANVLMYWNTPNVSASIIITNSMAIAAGNTLEPLLGCYLLHIELHQHSANLADAHIGFIQVMADIEVAQIDNTI